MLVAITLLWRKLHVLTLFPRKMTLTSFCQSQDLWVRVSVISIITSYNMENTGLIVQQIIVWRFAVCPTVLTLYIVVHLSRTETLLILLHWWFPCLTLRLSWSATFDESVHFVTSFLLCIPIESICKHWLKHTADILKHLLLSRLVLQTSEAPFFSCVKTPPPLPDFSRGNSSETNRFVQSDRKGPV